MVPPHCGHVHSTGQSVSLSVTVIVFVHVAARAELVVDITQSPGCYQVTILIAERDLLATGERLQINTTPHSRSRTASTCSAGAIPQTGTRDRSRSRPLPHAPFLPSRLEGTVRLGVSRLPYGIAHSGSSSDHLPVVEFAPSIRTWV